MKPEVKAAWIQALRSGEYQQGRNLLCHDDHFCCLGVLCDLHKKQTSAGDWVTEGDGIVDAIRMSYRTGKHKSPLSLPYPVVAWAGLDGTEPTVDGIGLSRLNDGLWTDGMLEVRARTFSEIADLIEQHL
jgi:hypothetical protein